jgi:hypothetical protein
VGGRGENKVQKKKKLRSGLRKGKEKKVNLGWHRDRKENPISAPSIHLVFLPMEVDVVLSNDGIHILVNVVIIDPIQTKLVS